MAAYTINLSYEVTTEMIDAIIEGSLFGSWNFDRKQMQTPGYNRYWLVTDLEDAAIKDKAVTESRISGSIEKVLKEYGSTRAAEYLRNALRDNDAGHIDAEAADVVWQVACLGDIIYG